MLGKEEEKYKENKTNFEGAYLGNSSVDSVLIWNWKYPTPREFLQKISCVSVQGLLSYRRVKPAFSLLLHLSVAGPGFLEPHDTLTCVLIEYTPKDHFNYQPQLHVKA